MTKSLWRVFGGNLTFLSSIVRSQTLSILLRLWTPASRTWASNYCRCSTQVPSLLRSCWAKHRWSSRTWDACKRFQSPLGNLKGRRTTNTKWRCSWAWSLGTLLKESTSCLLSLMAAIHSSVGFSLVQTSFKRLNSWVKIDLSFLINSQSDQLSHQVSLRSFQGTFDLPPHQAAEIFILLLLSKKKIAGNTKKFRVTNFNTIKISYFRLSTNPNAITCYVCHKPIELNFAFT